jgi:hypothetical protein
MRGDLPDVAPLGLPAGPSDDVALIDLLDRVLDRGVVIVGEVTLSVADIDLVDLSLRLTLSGIDGPTRGR